MLTQHTAPRRWKLTGLRLVGKGRDFSGVLPEIDPRLDHDEVVQVREDICCEADVEAVAQWLFGYKHGKDDLLWDEIEDPGRDLWRHNARSLLSAIFKAQT